MQDRDISKNVDINRFPAADAKPQMLKVRCERREHRAERFSPRSLLSFTRADEDDIAGARVRECAGMTPERHATLEVR